MLFYVDTDIVGIVGSWEPNNLVLLFLSKNLVSINQVWLMFSCFSDKVLRQVLPFTLCWKLVYPFPTILFPGRFETVEKFWDFSWTLNNFPMFVKWKNLSSEMTVGCGISTFSCLTAEMQWNVNLIHLRELLLSIFI